MSFQSYFNAEMRKLQQLTNDIQYPHPIIDRILEGCAHLSARIREQLDDDFPDIPAQILHHHWPFMLRAYASRTLIQFSRQTKTFFPKGTLIISEPVGEEKTVCKFTTLQDITVYPIQLLRVEIKNNNLLFYFNRDIPRIRLYLNTDSYTALNIYYAISQKNMFSAENTAQLWMDYFGFRESYLYLDIENIQQACAVLPLKNPLPLQFEIRTEWFLLNAVPAVNEFAMSAEPLLYKSSRWDYEIIPDHHRPKSILLQSLEKLSAAHTWEPSRKKLMIRDHQLKENAIISSDIIATNGHYPREYWIESKITMAMRPTPYLYVAQRRDYLWDVMRCLNIDLNHIDLNQIQQLFNWTRFLWAERQTKAILSLTQKTVHKIIKGVFYQGTGFALTLREESFSDIAEIYLWGKVCHAFFKLIMPLNHWVELVIMLSPSERVLNYDYF